MCTGILHYKMVPSVTVLAFIVIGLQTAMIEALECYVCNNVTTLANCNNAVICPHGHVCYSEYSTAGSTRLYNLGCRDPTVCPPTSATPVVGRAVGSGSCSECCHTGNCNRQLCQSEYTECSDVNDCSTLGSITNICVDTHHVKAICRRFCGLCSLVDGAWGSWSLFSKCSVTCNNGTQTRTRTCDSPPPSQGGKTCEGSGNEVRACSGGAECPVNGGWSAWSSWDACSATCDIGTQRRQRTCSNPAPENDGQPCQGYSWDTKICHPRACADGQWSTWAPWTGCTVSCGGGVATRHRTCTNPPPSMTGRYCVGDQMQAGTCMTRQCTTAIAFQAHNMYNDHPNLGEMLRFINAPVNEGNGYNTSTGYFTAPINGTYRFTFQLCTIIDLWVNLFIHADRWGVIARIDNGDSDITGTCSTGSGFALMTKGDRAWVTFENGHNDGFIRDNSRWNLFSGMLVGVTR